VGPIRIILKILRFGAMYSIFGFGENAPTVGVGSVKMVAWVRIPLGLPINTFFRSVPCGRTVCSYVSPSVLDIRVK
jgi:hypothetical protein